MFGTRRTWLLGGRRYAMSSADDQSIWYIDLSLNPPFCTCPQFMYRCRNHDVCKHIVFWWAFAPAYERGDDAVFGRRRGGDQPESDSRHVGLVRDERAGVADD